jgi:hypothetical protein
LGEPFDSPGADEHPVLRDPKHVLNGTDLRQTNLPGKVRDHPVAEVDGDMCTPGAVRSVEQQEIQRLQFLYGVAELRIFPQFAGPEGGRLDPEVPEKGVGPQLAIRSLAEIERRGLRMSSGVVGDALECGRNLKRHGHFSVS